MACIVKLFNIGLPSKKNLLFVVNIYKTKIMKIKSTLLLSLLTILFFQVKAQQPANGCFDTWTNTDNPAGWVTIENLLGSNVNTFSFRDSIDKTGSCAASLELVTDTVPGHAQFGVQGGVASLGTGSLGANGPSFQGDPIIWRPETLIFDYKQVSPYGEDKGVITVTLTSAGNTVLRLRYLLLDQANWTHMAIPLSSYYTNGNTPDTLDIQINSSGGASGHTANIGTNVHVDGLRFGYASQPQASSGVYTLGSDNIGSYNFNLYGAVNTSDSAAVYSFVYSIDSTFATYTTTATQNLTDNSLAVIWAKVSGLTPETNYFYYVQDSTSAGVSKGAVMKFYTDTISYFFENDGADVYGNNYAVMNGGVHGLQSSTAISFIWGLSPGNLDSVMAVTPSPVTDTNSYYFQETPNNLNPGATYFFRMMGITATDTIYSDIKAFYMGYPWTTYIALPPTNITEFSVTISTTVQGFPLPIRIASELDNNVLQTYFHYQPTYYDFTTAVINYSHNASGLQPSQYYGARFGVITWIGNYYADTAFTSLTSGIKEIAGQDNDVMVYPNPANSNLTVELKSNVNELITAQLFTLNGQMVNEFEIPANENKATLSVNELESGVYVLKLLSGDIFYTKKVTIVK